MFCLPTVPADDDENAADAIFVFVVLVPTPIFSSLLNLFTVKSGIPSVAMVIFLSSLLSLLLL